MQRHQQSSESFETFSEHLWQYLEARDWHQNEPRSLAISISLEAAELLEHYQWSDEPVGSREDIASELADVFMYTMQLAQLSGVDLAAAARKKLEEAGKKYPADRFKGKDYAHNRKVWVESKLQHRKQGL